MEKTRTGEIMRIGRVIDAGVATGLGRPLLALYEKYCKQSNLYGNGTLYPIDSAIDATEPSLVHPAADAISLPLESFNQYRSLLNGFRDRARGYVEHDEPVVGADFLFGRAAGGKWHIDGEFDYRELINISGFPIALLVATDWSDTGLGKDWLNTTIEPGEEPASYKSLSYSPGQAVSINNFCPISEQIPHLGSGEEHKVLLRMIASNPDGSEFLCKMS